MKIIGDMAIKDLTPQSTNIGERIVKNMRICGSGIYTYAKREASLLGLAPVPEKYSSMDFINVYRPPEVLSKYKDYFARVPIITGHHIRVDRENAKDLVVGMVGDSVNVEVDEGDGETYLYTTGTIVAEDGIEAYEKYGQLSVGYVPVMKWQEGEHKGVPYQAVLQEFQDVNHLLICKEARGGPQCMVMDSLDGMSPLERLITSASQSKDTINGGEDMGIFKKIFGSVNKKEIAGDEKVISALLQSIAVGADPETQVAKIRDIIGDSKDGTFNDYLDELSKAKSEKPEVIARAVEIVDNYYKDNLCGDEKNTTCPECNKEPCECKAPAGDEAKDEEPKAEDKKEEVAGDSVNYAAIDYDAIAEKVFARMQEAEKKKLADAPKPETSMPLAGDSKAQNTKTSDDFLKEIWG